MSSIPASQLPTILDYHIMQDKPVARLYAESMKSEEWGDALWLTSRPHRYEHLGRMEVGDVVIAFPGILDRLFNCVLSDNIINARIEEGYDYLKLGDGPGGPFQRAEVMQPGHKILGSGIEVQIQPTEAPERSTYIFRVKKKGGALVILTQAEQESLPDVSITDVRDHMDCHFKSWKEFARTYTHDSSAEVVVIRSVVRAARWVNFTFLKTGTFSVTIGTTEDIYTVVDIPKAYEGQIIYQADFNPLGIMNNVLFYKAIRMTRAAGAFFSLKAQAEPRGLDKHNPGSGSRVLSAGIDTNEPEIAPSTPSGALAAALRESASQSSQITKRYGEKGEFSTEFILPRLLLNSPYSGFIACAPSQRSTLECIRRNMRTFRPCQLPKLPLRPSDNALSDGQIRLASDPVENSF